MSNGTHEQEAAGELPVLDPQPRPRFQSLFSSETKGEGVPWLMSSPMPTPSPGANGWGLGGWVGSAQSALDEQYHVCGSRDLERAGWLCPDDPTCCGGQLLRRGQSLWLV